MISKKICEFLILFLILILEKHCSAEDEHSGNVYTAINDDQPCQHSNGTGDFLEEFNSNIQEPSASISYKESRKQFRKKNHKRSVSIVGLPCQENIDCITDTGGAYCDATKLCACLATYVNINGFCWAKRNPGDTCQYQDQCTSVSPNTNCNPSGICVCNNNLPAVRTIDGDGPFCISTGECPTNGANSKLRDYDSGVDVRCGGNGNLACRDKNAPTEEPNHQMYNCMCTPSNSMPDNPCFDDPNGYCCPTRAHACIQPKDEGSFSGGVQTQRWWYNSASGQCEPLAYRGSYGNGNNFITKSLCESYCKTMCPRGAPYWDPSSQSYSTGCTASTTCQASYNCSTKANLGRGVCCPTVDFICSNSGGISPTPNMLLPPFPDAGDRNYNAPTNVIRYYYNAAQGQCIQFTLNGIGGTFNSFQTQAECLTFCSSALCTNGEPLRDGSGNTVKCGGGGSSICPTKYTCSNNGVCCPTANFICGLPQLVGSCSNFVERWWFNPTTRSCEKFFYSGCQGNSNNFPTYQACTNVCGTSTTKPLCPQGEAAKDSGGTNYIVCNGAGSTTTTCPSDYYCYFDGTRYGCCPTRAKTCSLETQDQGTPCVTPVTRWWYNTLNKNCEQFTYNGCDGNSNNFATKIDCQDYCGVGGCPEGGEPFRDAFNGNYRVCGVGGVQCPTGYTCSIVTLGTSARYNYCCPTRASVCLLTADQGQRCGSTTLNRYYFNSISRTCEMFTYNGCGGNRNNFATIDQCLQYCNSAGCPAGQVALQDAGTKQVTTCDVTTNTCPSSYRCTMSNVIQQGICCGSAAPPGACPAGQIAYMDLFSNMPLQCQPNVDGSCPNGIFCQYSFVLANSFCCSTAAVQCPQGGDPYLDSFNQPRQCTPGLPSPCPTGYNCQATSLVVDGVPSTTGYCCGQTNLCGTGYVPYYVNNQPVPCVIGQVPSACQAPAVCLQNINGQSYCCTTSATQTMVCASGKQPYVVQGSPTLCTTASPSTACPPNYSCDFYQPTGSYYCCGVTGQPPPPPPPTTGTECPAPYTLLQPVQTCSPGVPGQCPNGYFCNYDSPRSRYVCCGSGTGTGGGGTLLNYCVAPSQPYINPGTGQPQACTLGTPSTGCPQGYRCLYSNTYSNYYCCSGAAPGPPVPTRPPSPPIGTAQCPPPYVPFVTPAGQPQTCILGQTTCPRGYVCTNAGRNIAICCGQRTTTVGSGDPYGCPSGNAYLYPGTRTPLACTRNGRSCPVGYTCLQSTRSSIFQCCSNSFARQVNAFRTNESPQVSLPSNSQPSNGRRPCRSNLDCKDSVGKVTSICRLNFCMD